VSRLRLLVFSLVGLAVAATLAAGATPAVARGPLAWILWAGLPIAVGALGGIVAPRRRRLPHPARVRVPALAHAPLVALLVAADLAPLVLGWKLGWIVLGDGGAGLSIPRAAALVVGLPVAVFLAVHGWEWGLRARLYGVGAERGAPRRAAAASVACGTLLALPAVAPGFAVPDVAFLAGALAVALARETTALVLFRRGGVLLSGGYRGTLFLLDGFLVGDALALWMPSFFYVAAVPDFYALRAAGPILGLVAAAIWIERLERADADRRREP
jgi:hypothetical protein